MALNILSESFTCIGVAGLCYQVCESTYDYAGCVQALPSDPRTDGATDLATLTTISLDLAASNATEALVLVVRMDEDPSTSPDLKSALDFCTFAYQHTVLSFRNANEEVKYQSASVLGIAFDDVMAALRWSESCSQELTSDNLSVPEISKAERSDSPVL